MGTLIENGRNPQGFPQASQASSGFTRKPESVFKEAEAEKIACPKCGATEITYNEQKGKLICDFCRTEFSPKGKVADEVTNTIADVAKLSTQVLSEGMKATAPINTDIQAFKCPNCKAELGVGAEVNIGALKCHWCRHQISVADKITNGVRPDAVIEFAISKEQAKANIAEELRRKKFFALPAFVQQFDVDAIKPVYLPYVTVDINSRNYCKGKGGVFKDTHKRDDVTYYDYDLFEIEREFDFQMNNLLIEANDDYFVPVGHDPIEGSKNVLNNVQPFDSSKVKPYTPLYFNGDYRVEFKNVQFEAIQTKAHAMVHDVAFVNMQQASCQQYTHGVAVEDRTMDEYGANYCYVLAPIWLYSYCDDAKQVHYIAVNGQTGKTSACVPVHMAKLITVSAVIELCAIAVVGLVLLGSLFS